LLGLALALVISLFFGIGAVLSGNAGNLPDQKLPLRTDGCYQNESVSTMDILPLKESTFWKEQEYSTLDNLFAISFQWQPMIPVVGTIVFGLMFSIVVNIVRKVESIPVKQRYLTPVTLSMWVNVFGKKGLSRWVEFDVFDSDKQQEIKDESNPKST
jgi:hypothetical protein